MSKSRRVRTEEVVGKVREVVSNGLYMLDGGTTALLPKENMHIGKKKIIRYILKGYVIKAKVKSKRS